MSNSYEADNLELQKCFIPRDALVLLSWGDPCQCDFMANSENINLLIFRTQLFSPSLCVASGYVHMDTC